MNRILIAILISFLSSLFVSCSPSIDELYNIAYNLEGQKKYKEAIEVYNKILQKNHKLQDAYFGKGYCCLQDSNYISALYFFEHTKSLKFIGDFIFEENKDSPFASEEAKHQVPIGQIYYQIGVTKYYMDSLKSSYENFGNSITYKYKIGDCYLWQGLIWISNDSVQRGCNFFQKALRMGEEDASRFIKKYCK